MIIKPRYCIYVKYRNTKILQVLLRIWRVWNNKFRHCIYEIQKYKILQVLLSICRVWNNKLRHCIYEIQKYKNPAGLTQDMPGMK